MSLTLDTISGQYVYVPDPPPPPAQEPVENMPEVQTMDAAYMTSIDPNAYEEPEAPPPESTGITGEVVGSIVDEVV